MALSGGSNDHRAIDRKWAVNIHEHNLREHVGLVAIGRGTEMPVSNVQCIFRLGDSWKMNDGINVVAGYTRQTDFEKARLAAIDFFR